MRGKGVPEEGVESTLSSRELDLQMLAKRLRGQKDLDGKDIEYALFIFGAEFSKLQIRLTLTGEKFIFNNAEGIIDKNRLEKRHSVWKS